MVKPIGKYRLCTECGKMIDNRNCFCWNCGKRKETKDTVKSSGVFSVGDS